MNRTKSLLSLSFLTLLIGGLVVSCSGSYQPEQPKSASGVTKLNVKVQVDPTTGQTIEQSNIAKRLKLDNAVGSIKHLYIISPSSGQVLLYSTVKGKVTSSGKRLTPNTINSSTYGFEVNIGGEKHYTSEVLQDDGTYGNSSEYIYWFDAAGRFHQHWFTGGQIIHLSDQPIAVKSVVLNLETAGK
ncbi:MAG: hypothetical protein Q8T09_03145 [Candidatus Melainabacteria bacterium]|nr:hypothetical protein [Candidatus Melainabacteria bacterium]